MFHVGVGMYRKCFGAADPFDTVTLRRSRRLACVQQFFSRYQFIPGFSQRDTVTTLLTDNQRLPAAVDAVIVTKRDGA